MPYVIEIFIQMTRYVALFATDFLRLACLVVTDTMSSSRPFLFTLAHDTLVHSEALFFVSNRRNLSQEVNVIAASARASAHPASFHSSQQSTWIDLLRHERETVLRS